MRVIVTTNYHFAPLASATFIGGLTTQSTRNINFRLDREASCDATAMAAEIIDETSTYTNASSILQLVSRSNITNIF